jgi:hypothetical protein
MAPAQPELKKVSLTKEFEKMLRNYSLILPQYLDKRLFVQLNGSRKVIGVLRGYDVCHPSARPLQLEAYELTVEIGLPEYCSGRCRGGEGWW